MDYIKGRGSQFNPKNKFNSTHHVLGDDEALDELPTWQQNTRVTYEFPKQIVNKVTSPDLPMPYSLNPYQGCEHGCIYCYARNTHTYYGLSAGLDFEQQIFAKPEAPKLLKAFLSKTSYRPQPISLSGNTDCYQPIEKKLRITRSLLEVFLQFKNPVGIITKNSLILRDMDILTKLAELNLVRVMISITTLDESLRRKMEPRTASSVKRLEVIKELSDAGIPVGVMTAPLIPSLNTDEIPELIRLSSKAGARSAGYIIARLNGSVKEIFHDWLHKNFKDRANKVWNQLLSCHGGSVSDNRFGKRMSGEGNIAESIKSLHAVAVRKYMGKNKMPDYDLSHFNLGAASNQLKLF